MPPEFIPHALRHCHASAALARGVPITDIFEGTNQIQRLVVSHDLARC